MARTLPEIDQTLERWIARQPMFFVGTAPLSGDGHVNVSPKGPISTLSVLGPHEVAYLDLIGSGAETIAHLRENGRVVVMFCAFEGPPRIVRLHGRGEVLLPEDERFAALAPRFEAPVAEVAHRSIIRVDVERVHQSCGYGVPLMDHVGEREHQPKWVDKKLRTGGPASLRRYQDEKNAASIDGLPAVPART
jgi:Pyridoxamine 5'-phosphate oxidase